MKASSLIACLVALAARDAHGFAPTSLLCSLVRSSSSDSGRRSLVRGMVEDGYNDEVANLMAAAAKAREEAARLAKVRLSLD
jgi:hypothetical protein